jgi:FlaA1/EpsC-like NDP-sugar epimerase
MKKALVFGAAGSIGSELVNQLKHHYKVYCVDIDETGVFDVVTPNKEQGWWVEGRVGDIRNEDTVEEVYSDFRPDIVFNAAAYKHVPLMQLTPVEAIHTNALGTHNLIKWAKKYETKKFVQISTDKAVYPQSVMGATKLLCEMLIRQAGKGFISVRFGNVVGSRGSVSEIWRRQTLAGEPITLTNPDMKRFFMTIADAVKLVIKAGEEGKGGETYILDMGLPKRMGDLANEWYPKYPQKVIGVRLGEIMEEKLMTDEERKIAKKVGKYWIIR